jgi:hypothetical protein
MQFPNNPCRIAEDDRLRSSHMRELVQETVPIDAPSGPAHIPRVIVQYWHDSGAIPPDVRECLESWGPLTGQGFKRVLFDDSEARRFIARRFGVPYVAAFDRCHHPAMRCDYFRLCYISKHGGFYVDADEVYQGGECQSLFRDNRLKIQPLCYDSLNDTMVRTEVFTENRAYSPDWTFYVNNNPLIAPASHPIVNLALDRSTRILLSRGGERLDIQSTTGPGNLTASLVRHSIASKTAGRARDFLLLTNWEAMSISRWPLSYRGDERNWRLWNPTT